MSCEGCAGARTVCCVEHHVSLYAPNMWPVQVTANGTWFRVPVQASHLLPSTAVAPPLLALHLIDEAPQPHDIWRSGLYDHWLTMAQQLVARRVSQPIPALLEQTVSQVRSVMASGVVVMPLSQLAEALQVEPDSNRWSLWSSWLSASDVPCVVVQGLRVPGAAVSNASGSVSSAVGHSHSHAASHEDVLVEEKKQQVYDVSVL